MIGSLRTRTPLIAAAALVAVGAPVAIAATSGTTLKVHGPATLKVDQKFTVGARGHVAKKRVVAVTIAQHRKCAATYGDDRDNGSYIAFVRSVGPGDYDEKRSGLHFGAKSKGHYCAYLAKGSDSVYATPRAKDSKAFVVKAK